MGDEELAAAGVGPIERHADGPSKVRTLVQLVADRVTRSSFAVAAGIAILDDETGHDAVDAEAVEETLACERHEIVDGQWSIEDGQLDLDRAAVGVDVDLGRHFRIDQTRRG